MRQVKPYGGEPNEVDDAVDRAAEQRRDVGRAVGGREGTEFVVADDLGELHVVPEVVKVQQQSEHDDDPEHVHVPRSPRNPFGLGRHGVALAAPRAAVVKGQHRRIDQMHDHAGGQDQRAGERVPVGTQKLADRVVSLRREDGRQVHRHVEQQKQHEEKTRDTHNQFPPDGRC